MLPFAFLDYLIDPITLSIQIGSNNGLFFVWDNNEGEIE